MDIADGIFIFGICLLLGIAFFVPVTQVLLYCGFMAGVCGLGGFYFYAKTF